MWNRSSSSGSGNDDDDEPYVRWSDRRRRAAAQMMTMPDDDDTNGNDDGLQQPQPQRPPSPSDARDAAHLQQALLSPSTPEDYHRAAALLRRGGGSSSSFLSSHQSSSDSVNNNNTAPAAPRSSFHETSFSLANLFRWNTRTAANVNNNNMDQQQQQQLTRGRSWWLLGRGDSSDDEDDDDDDYYHNINSPTRQQSATAEYPDDDDYAAADSSGWLARYHNWIRRHRRHLLALAVLVVWPCGVGRAFREYQLHWTDSTLHRAIAGSPSRTAQNAFRRAYSYDSANNNSTNSSTSKNGAVQRDDALNPPLVLVLESVVLATANNNDSGAQQSTTTTTTTTNSNRRISLTRDNSTVAYQQARNFSLQLLPYLRRRCWRWSPPPPAPTNNNSTNSSTNYSQPEAANHKLEKDCTHDEDWLSVTSYYSVVEDGLSWIADGSLAVRDGSMVLLEVAYTLPDDTDDGGDDDDEHEQNGKHKKHHKRSTVTNKQRVLDLMEAVDDYRREFLANVTSTPSNDDNNNATTNSTTRPQPYFTVHYTGLKYFASDLAVSTRHDLRRMDWTALPLALVLLGAVLPSANAWAVWVVPVATMLTTVGVWSLVMRYGVCQFFATSGLTVSTFTPTVQMSLTLGMGIDYNLFLLARYLQEMTEPPRQQQQHTVPGHQHQHRSRRRRAAAVHRMLAGSGHVLVLSGLTLAATFAGLVFLPLGMLQSVGVGAAVAIVAALAVNLTVVPALLYTPLGLWVIRRKEPSVQDEDIDGGDNDNDNNNNITSNLDVVPLPNERRVLRFEEPQLTSASTEDDPNGDGQGDAATDALLEEPLIPTPHRRCLSSGDVNRDQQNRMPRSLWFRLSKHLLHPYRGIIILLLTCQLLLPVARHAGQLKSSISFDLLLPSKSPSLQTFHALGAKKGYGALNPYRILFDGHEANMTMTSSSAFGIMHLVLDELRAAERSSSAAAATTTDPRCLDERETNELRGNEGVEEQIELLTAQILDADRLEQQRDECAASLNARRPKRTSYSGIAVLKNVEIPYPVFVSAKYCAQRKRNCPIQLLRLLDAIDEQATSQDEYATFITATLGSSPFSDEGVAWLEAARETIERLDQEGVLWGVKVYVEGSAGIAHDAVDAVYRAFPTMAAITIGVIFGVMGCFFRSMFAPVRSIVSISLTLAFSFGLAVCVFQEGAFNWTNIRLLTSIGDEVCWLVPIMAFSILIGLALDYDVFLISRVLEFRLEGNEHRSSIALGLDSTGGTIAAAGAIMAVAFGSLLFSSNPVLYQWSFILTTAVLVHTFFVEPLVVPILTSLSGKYCWWPRRLPEEQFCFVEFQERDYDDVAGLLRTLESSSEYEPLSRP